MDHEIFPNSFVIGLIDDLDFEMLAPGLVPGTCVAAFTGITMTIAITINKVVIQNIPLILDISI